MVEIHPLKNARLSDEVTHLPVLVQIEPSGSRLKSRPALNLALVLDRSGSMHGKPLELTKEAAVEAVRRLSSDDTITVVTFETEVELLYSGGAGKSELEEVIQSIESANQTALFDGWRRAVDAMTGFQDPRRLSRLILLTDGQANQGLTDPTMIGSHVATAARRGIQTTTLGFGQHYNEELLRDMAKAGGGNHCFIESPQMLGDFFGQEMQSLADTQGTFVRLRLRPGTNVSVTGLESKYQDLEGRICLANLVAGQPLSVLFHLEIEQDAEEQLLSVELEWHDLAEGGSCRESLSLALPKVDRERWSTLVGSSLVQEHLALEEANILRERAMRLTRLRAHEIGLQWLDWALKLPHLPEEEKAVLKDLVETLERGDYSAGFKKSAMYSHGHGHGHARSVAYYGSARLETGERKTYNTLPLGKGPALTRNLREPYPKWKRVEGMLRGHFFGERLVRGNRTELGEGSVLSAITLRQRLERHFEPRALALAFCEAPVLHPTTSLQKFRRNFDQGSGNLLDLGSPSAGCAALRRMSPLLVNLHNDVREDLFLEATLATVLTHRDNLAITASIGYLALLWELLHQPLTPPREFYSQVFLKAIQGLEWGDGYRCPEANKAMDGWRGHLQEYLPRVLQEARKREWSAETAMKLWGSGPYLLEIIPTVLYILELHGHDPDRALRVASNNTFEPDTPAILVGAALGALHGGQPGWFLADELEELLEATQQAWHQAGLTA